MNEQRRALKQAYKEQPPPLGILQIRNLTNDKVLVLSTRNLPAMRNRQQFQLQMGSHPNRSLQADWNALGATQFVIETLDEITPSNDPNRDLLAELAALEELWLDQLQPYHERGYNERPQNREQRLQMIQALRRQPEEELPATLIAP